MPKLICEDDGRRYENIECACEECYFDHGDKLCDVILPENGCGWQLIDGEALRVGDMVKTKKYGRIGTILRITQGCRVAIGTDAYNYTADELERVEANE